MPIVVDAVAIVAAIDRREQWHQKAKRLFQELPKPLLTCEAALTESCFLLGESTTGIESVFALMSEGVVSINFSLSNEADAVLFLMRKYRDVPMSLADACLVRMSEIFDAPVFTFDSDFRIYRRNRRGAIPLIGIEK
jgi:uncharacterized protein